MDVFFVIPSKRNNSLNVLENIKRQNIPNAKTVIVENGFAVGHYKDFDYVIQSENNVTDARNAGVSFVLKQSKKPFIIWMDDDDWYGENYSTEILDNINNGDMLGKHSVFYKLGNDFVFIDGITNKVTNLVHGPTMAGFAEVFVEFPKVNKWGEDIGLQEKLNGTIYSLSEDYFCGIRHDIDHTWSINNYFFFKLFEKRLFVASGELGSLKKTNEKVKEEKYKYCWE